MNDEQNRLLGNLDAKADMLLASQADLMERVTKLEASISWAKGAAWVVGGVASLTGAISGFIASLTFGGSP